MMQIAASWISVMPIIGAGMYKEAIESYMAGDKD